MHEGCPRAPRMMRARCRRGRGLGSPRAPDPSRIRSRTPRSRRCTANAHGGRRRRHLEPVAWIRRRALDGGSMDDPCGLQPRIDTKPAWDTLRTSALGDRRCDPDRTPPGSTTRDRCGPATPAHPRASASVPLRRARARAPRAPRPAGRSCRPRRSACRRPSWRPQRRCTHRRPAACAARQDRWAPRRRTNAGGPGRRRGGRPPGGGTPGRPTHEGRRRGTPPRASRPSGTVS